MHLSDGSRLGPYEILGSIGAGGMGEVYRARDTRLGREVAVKILPRHVSADPDRLARFEREARCSSALNHRNIVTIHDFSSQGGEAWLVMELIRGESLRSALSRGPMPLKPALATACGIADGLAAAHDAGLVHRDLKPENVMIAADGTPKILDFGLVKVASSGTSDPSSPTEVLVTEAGVVVGTASYMSPEQARGEAVDHRTDQFSFGLILHELITGKHPFRRATQVETLAAILNDEYSPPPDAPPEPLLWILERCLAKNPSDRYGSTADLAHDLARVRDGRRQSPVSAQATPAPRWRAMAIAMGVVAVLAAALLGLESWRRGEDRMEAAVQASVPTPEVADVYLDEVAVPVALSPDGTRLIVHGADADGTSGLWLHDLRTGGVRRITEKTFSAAWSPDSRSIAFFADGKLKTMPVDGGPARIVCDARPEGMPSWSGDTILFNQYSERPGVYRVSAGGGEPELVPTVGPLAWWPAFLPDGKHFLYLTLAGRDKDIMHRLFMGSLDGTLRKFIGEIDSRALFTSGHLLYVRDGTLLAQRFDPEKGELSGEVQPLVEGLHYFHSTGQGAFSASANGVLAWRSARRPARLVWLDRTGGELQAIGTAAFHADGRLSPDGRRYATGVVDPKLGVSDLWIYDLQRESNERVTFRSLDEHSPVWTPDGGAIYYRSDGGGGPPDVFRVAPGDEAGVRFYGGRAVEEPKDVAPDGRSLLFATLAPPSRSDIRILPLVPKGEARPYLATPFNELAPRFSPDGRWVAYQSDVSGRPEVYVRPFEGSTVTTRISKNGGKRPVWRRDGTELYFLEAGGRFMAAAMKDGVPGPPRILFQAPSVIDYDVALDGSKFLVQLEERSTEPVVQLLVNWPARLQGAN
jgi:Tol biopolymer transport system component